MLFRRLEKQVGTPESFGLPPHELEAWDDRPTMSLDFLPALRAGKIGVKPDIRAFEGPWVEFVDGSRLEADVILYATGYEMDFPYLSEETLGSGAPELRLYQRVVHPSHENLFFVGCCRVLCSIWPLAEQQARWISRQLRGEFALPSEAERIRQAVPLSKAKPVFCNFYIDSLRQQAGGVLYEVETEVDEVIGVIILTIPQTNGVSTSNSGTWGGGSAFAGTTTILPPTTSPVSTITVKVGNHSPLSVTSGGAVSGGVQTADICSYLFGFCAIGFSTTLGQAGTATAGSYGINVTVVSQQWTTGVATAKGLTSNGLPLPNVTTTGSFNLTAGGAGTISLVVANKLIISGPSYGLQSTTSSGSLQPILRLRYKVPEPGSLLLVGAGALGLVMMAGAAAPGTAADPAPRGSAGLLEPIHRPLEGRGAREALLLRPVVENVEHVGPEGHVHPHDAGEGRPRGDEEGHGSPSGPPPLEDLIDRARLGDLLAVLYHALEVELQGFLREGLSLVEGLSSRHAPREVRELDAVVAVRVLAEKGDVAACHGVLSFAEPDAGLPLDAPERPSRKLSFRMGHRHSARPFGVLQLHMRADLRVSLPRNRGHLEG